MDLANDIDERFALARLSPKDQQNSDEAKRLQDDVLSAIERLERRSFPLAIARPIGPSVFDRTDVSELISNLHFSPTTSPFSRWKLLGIRVIVGVVSAGFAISVVSIAANTEWLALTDFSVIHSLASLTGVSSDAGVEETMPTRVQNAITAPTPATLSVPIPTIAESGGVPPDQVSAPAKTAPPNVGSTESAELAQTVIPMVEYEPIGLSKEDKNASSPIYSNVSVPVSPQQNVSSPEPTVQNDDAVLFRQFLESRANQAKPQLGQERQSHKRVKGLHVLRSHRRNVPDVAITTTNSSLRTQSGVGRHDPSDAKEDGARKLSLPPSLERSNITSAGVARASRGNLESGLR
jgi:hypothetical protein